MYEVTARAQDPAERAAFARALSARGFNVVDHDPYKGQLEVFLTHEDHSVPTITFWQWYRVGSRDEVPGQTGIAHFIEHLMFKGTPSLAKGEIDRLTMQAGGGNNAFTASDYTAYVFNLPADHWMVALRIEADRRSGG